MNQSFYDDSSSALELNHGATCRSADDLERQRQKRQADLAEAMEIRRTIIASGVLVWIIDHLRGDEEGRNLQPADRETIAYERYREMGTDAVRSRVKEYVEAGGKNLKDAMMLAAGDVAKADRISAAMEGGGQDDEDDSPDDWSGSDDRNEQKIKSLMRAPVKPSGGGSRNGKGRKKRPKKDGRGRPYVEYDEPRDNQRSIYMTDSTKYELDKLNKSGIGASDVMALVARALMSGKTLAEIVGDDIMDEVTGGTPINTPQNNEAA